MNLGHRTFIWTPHPTRLAPRVQVHLHYKRADCASTLVAVNVCVKIVHTYGGLGTDRAGGLPEQRTIPFIVAGPLATTVLPQANPRQVDVALFGSFTMASQTVRRKRNRVGS